MCNECRNNSRKLWQLLRQITCKQVDKTSITSSLNVDGSSISGPQAISNAFARYFSNIGGNLACKITNSNKKYSEYLSNRNINTMFMSPTSVAEVLKVINGLKSKASTGHDNISNLFVKNIKNCIANPLCTLFNKSLNEGVFPSQMKLATVIPLFKSCLLYTSPSPRDS